MYALLRFFPPNAPKKTKTLLAFVIVLLWIVKKCVAQYMYLKNVRTPQHTKRTIRARKRFVEMLQVGGDCTIEMFSCFQKCVCFRIQRRSSFSLPFSFQLFPALIGTHHRRSDIAPPSICVFRGMDRRTSYSKQLRYSSVVDCICVVWSCLKLVDVVL